MILFFDTETTGKANFKLPHFHESQPRLVQLGALLTDFNGKELSSIDLVINPQIEISVETSNIHGITTEIARACGVMEQTAVAAFEDLASRAHTIVAHNDDFDHLIMRAAAHRQGITDSAILRPRRFCTMKATTNLCKLPSGWGGNYKWPKLSEAYRHCFNEELLGAHNAMVDVRACARIFFFVQGMAKHDNELSTQ